MGGAISDAWDATKEWASDPVNLLVPAYGMTKSAVNVATGKDINGNESGAPAPAQPNQPAYSSGPGIQTGVYQNQLDSLNMAGPGAGESFYDNNQSVWSSPSFGETNAQGIVGQYSGGNTPQTTNNSQGWLNQYEMPSIASDPGLAPYFDNAKNRASESINQSMAARGAYGSSAANDQMSRAYTDLEGQRALHEADYNLRRLGEQRAWQGLGGQLAGQADQQSLAQSADEQRWQQFLGQLGLDSSQLGLQRTNSGMDAAGNAQNLQRNRGNDYFNQQLALGDRMSGLMSEAYYPALANDAALQDKIASGGVAQGNNAAAQEAQNAQNTLDYAKMGLQGYEYFGK